jgi:hypothetical protein
MVKHINSYEYALLRLLQNYANPLARANGMYEYLRHFTIPTNRQLLNANRKRKNLRMKYYQKRNEIAKKFERGPLEVQLHMNRLNFSPATLPRTP